MPQTTEISTNDREAYTLFIRFLRSSVPQLSADISRRLTARMANAVQEATWQTRMMVPVSKVQCTCSVAAIDDFSPIVEASFQILYRNYPIQFKLSERIPVRSTVTLSIFRKVDWEKLFLALKNDIYAAFRKMTDNMPLFILPIDSLPSDLKELYQHRMRKIGNVTAICTKELVSKYAFYIGGNNCIRIVNWRDNAISLAAKDFRPEKKSWKTKIDPDDKRKLIADPLSFLGFCSLASQTLSKPLVPTPKKKPAKTSGQSYGFIRLKKNDFQKEKLYISRVKCISSDSDRKLVKISQEQDIKGGTCYEGYYQKGE